MLQTTSKQLNTKVFSSTIREAIAVKEAQGERTNIFEYAPKAKVTQDVQAFIDEALEGMNDDGK
jgi:chromosome partitioning protein